MRPPLGVFEHDVRGARARTSSRFHHALADAGEGPKLRVTRGVTRQQWHESGGERWRRRRLLHELRNGVFADH